MDDFQGKDLLLGILEKGADAITEAEREILMARISYLSKEQIEKYGLIEKAPKGKK